MESLNKENSLILIFKKHFCRYFSLKFSLIFYIDNNSMVIDYYKNKINIQITVFFRSV